MQALFWTFNAVEAGHTGPSLHTFKSRMRRMKNAAPRVAIWQELYLAGLIDGCMLEFTVAFIAACSSWCWQPESSFDIKAILIIINRRRKVQPPPVEIGVQTKFYEPMFIWWSCYHAGRKNLKVLASKSCIRLSAHSVAEFQQRGVEQDSQGSKNSQDISTPVESAHEIMVSKDQCDFRSWNALNISFLESEQSNVAQKPRRRELPWSKRSGQRSESDRKFSKSWSKDTSKIWICRIVESKKMWCDHHADDPANLLT